MTPRTTYYVLLPLMAVLATAIAADLLVFPSCHFDRNRVIPRIGYRVERVVSRSVSS